MPSSLPPWTWARLGFHVRRLPGGRIRVGRGAAARALFNGAAAGWPRKAPGRARGGSAGPAKAVQVKWQCARPGACACGQGKACKCKCYRPLKHPPQGPRHDPGTHAGGSMPRKGPVHIQVSGAAPCGASAAPTLYAARRRHPHCGPSGAVGPRTAQTAARRRYVSPLAVALCHVRDVLV